MNRRANWQWIIGVIHDHDRDLFVTKMRCKELPDSNQGDFRCWRAIDSSCWYPWLEDLFAFGLPYQINSQLLVIWLLLSTKLCFHFTVWVVRSRPHLNVFNFFLLHTATYVSYITEYEPCTWHHVAQLVFYLNLHNIYGNKQLIVLWCDFMDNIQHSCASRVHSLHATSKYMQ